MVMGVHDLEPLRSERPDTQMNENFATNRDVQNEPLTKESSRSRRTIAIAFRQESNVRSLDLVDISTSIRLLCVPT